MRKDGMLAGEFRVSPTGESAVCLFVAAIIPDRAMTPEFAAIAAVHRVPKTQLSNSSLSRQLAPTEHAWITTRSHCDCGSQLFSRPKERSPEHLQREIQKLKKKGWREAKIQKWIHATEASTTPRPTESVVSQPEWFAFLTETLSLNMTPYVAILGHWYRGDLSTEEIRIEDRIRRQVEELGGSGFRVLLEDTVYEFRLADEGGVTHR